MKTRLSALMLVFAMVFGLTPGIVNGETGIKMWVEGNYITMDVKPYVEDSRTLIPIRFVTEALGYQVTFNGEEEKVILNKDTEEIIMTIGSKHATFNGEAIVLHKEPNIKDNRTFIPVRDVAERFGKLVDWDGETKTVIIGEGYGEPDEDLKEDLEEETNDIVDIALANKDFSILVAALQKAELVETLQGEGPFTVFAPTNAAFEQLLMALDVTAEDLLAQPDLGKVLTYHVLAGKVMSTDLSDGMKAATVNGQEIMVDLSDGVKINESTVITADLEVDNGVIHVIDKVLVPEDFKLQ